MSLRLLTGTRRRQTPAVIKLPDGVKPSNKETAAVGDGDRWAAPNVATPRFSDYHRKHNSKAKRVVREEYEEIIEDDDDDDFDEDYRSRSDNKPSIALMVSIAAIMLALMAFIFAMSNNRLPLCSDQADWNQFNCRAG